MVLPRDFLYRCVHSLSQSMAEWVLSIFAMLGIERRLLGQASNTLLPEATVLLWIHRASAPQRSDDLYEKEFQLRREQGNYFYQGKWRAAEEFDEIMRQKRRARKILLVDLGLLFGIFIVVILLLSRILWLFIAA